MSDEVTGRSEKVLAERYSRLVTSEDTLGRKITVRRLRPSEQVHISALVESLAGQIILMRAAAVTQIDDGGIVTPYKPTIALADLERMADRLSDEGIAAVAEATKQHEAPKA